MKVHDYFLIESSCNDRLNRLGALADPGTLAGLDNVGLGFQVVQERQIGGTDTGCGVVGLPGTGSTRFAPRYAKAEFAEAPSHDDHFDRNPRTECIQRESRLASSERVRSKIGKLATRYEQLQKNTHKINAVVAVRGLLPHFSFATN
jgi:hypothetical protein